MDIAGPGQVDAIAGVIRRQGVILIPESLGHVHQRHVLILGHLGDGRIVLLDPGIGDVFRHSLFRPYRLIDWNNGLKVDRGVRLQRLDLVHQLGIGVLKTLDAGIAQLVDPQHQIHLGELLICQGLQHGHLLPVPVDTVSLVNIGTPTDLGGK